MMLWGRFRYDLIAFGALMVAGCPSDNKASNTGGSGNAAPANAPANK